MGCDCLSTTIRVKRDLKRALDELKSQMGFRDYSELVEFLVKKESEPRSVFDVLYYWTIDMRSDVKKLIEVVGDLNTALREIRALLESFEKYFELLKRFLEKCE